MKTKTNNTSKMYAPERTKKIAVLQNLPSATELSSIHREVWKPSDLKRMEKLVLDKLDWNLYPSSSSLSFQEIMLIVLQQVDAEGIDDQFSSAVVERLELFLNYSNCCVYKVSQLICFS